MLGQPEAVQILEKKIQNGTMPHALLFAGPSGCGKTTLARILKGKLECSDLDFQEINTADFRGIDTARDIRMAMNYAPTAGKCRIWLIDEAHRATADFQAACLKLLEDTPSHVYFMLATTEPQKLLKTIITRCTTIQVKSLSSHVLEKLIQYVSEKEGIKLTEEITDGIIAASDGSGRKALVLLGQVVELDDEESQLNMLLSIDAEKQAISLAKALLNFRTRWEDISKIIKGIDEEPEKLRYMVLGYASSVLLKGGKLAPRAYLIVNAFESNFYDSKRAGLIRACWEVIGNNKGG